MRTTGWKLLWDAAVILINYCDFVISGDPKGQLFSLCMYVRKINSYRKIYVVLVLFYVLYEEGKITITVNFFCQNLGLKCHTILKTKNGPINDHIPYVFIIVPKFQ